MVSRSAQKEAGSRLSKSTRAVNIICAGGYCHICKSFIYLYPLIYKEDEEYKV